MSASGRHVVEIALWELRRLFRWRDAVATLVTFAVAGLAFFAAQALVAGAGEASARIGWSGEVAHPPADPTGRFELVRWGTTDAEIDGARRVAEREVDAWLELQPDGPARLHVRKDPVWLPALRALLDDAARRARLERAALSAEELEALLAPQPLEVLRVDGGPAGSGVRWAVGAVVLMTLGVFLGNAYLFTGITGEKQQRVTEQLLSCVSAQSWIDGKILGVIATTAISLAITVVSAAATNGVLGLLGAGLAMPAPPPWTAALPIALCGALGFAMWFAFFGAVAATIDDPNASQRSGLLMVPLLPAIFVLAPFRNPDGWLSVAGSLFPPTAPFVLPVRLVLAESVPLWQTALACALLVATIAALRRFAGAVFRLGILMHGKEPSWSEMLRAGRGR